METPGTAPGSEPLITSAFMSIVPKDRVYIGADEVFEKGRLAKDGLVEGVVWTRER